MVKQLIASRQSDSRKIAMQEEAAKKREEYKNDTLYSLKDTIVQNNAVKSAKKYSDH